MHIIPTTLAASTSGIGALGFKGTSFLIQLITFILAFLVLKRYAFGPIIKVLNERHKVIDEGVKLGEKMKEDEAKLEAEVEKTLHETRTKADDILASAQESARQAIRSAEEQAKAKADNILDAAENRIVQETAQARTKLEKEIVGLVADVSEAIIKEKVDVKKDAELIDSALKEQRA